MKSGLRFDAPTLRDPPSIFERAYKPCICIRMHTRRKGRYIGISMDVRAYYVIRCYVYALGGNNK